MPIYTEEARKQKVEGEVLVEAVLEASGKVKVLRVVRGLGHGLDEEAVKEAGQLRFKPGAARRPALGLDCGTARGLSDSINS